MLWIKPEGARFFFLRRRGLDTWNCKLISARFEKAEAGLGIWLWPEKLERPVIYHAAWQQEHHLTCHESLRRFFVQVLSRV